MLSVSQTILSPNINRASVLLRSSNTLLLPQLRRLSSIKSIDIKDLKQCEIDTATLPKAKRNNFVKLDTAPKPPEQFLTPSAFPHPLYDPKQMSEIQPEHRKPTSISDYVALYGIRTLRSIFDLYTNYKDPHTLSEQIEIAQSANRMTTEKWLTRFIILESVAGIPGSVAGFLRHLDSLRLLRRDKAFIETLLDEAYNERMHLLTFMQIAKPGLFIKTMLVLGQGVFANIFFMFYLISPKCCHRFVGYLEEEAVGTYTRCLQDMKMGLIPEMNQLKVPDIAKKYWKLPEDANMEMLIEYVRADEAKHREVNHTFANLKIRGKEIDRNPFVLKVDGVDKAQPSKTLENHKATGWEKNDLIL